MGNCSLKAVSATNAPNSIRVLTDSGSILEFNPPKLAHELLTFYPGHGIFRRGHGAAPMGGEERLLQGRLYYILPLAALGDENFHGRQVAARDANFDGNQEAARVENLIVASRDKRVVGKQVAVGDEVVAGCRVVSGDESSARKQVGDKDEFFTGKRVEETDEDISEKRVADIDKNTQGKKQEATESGGDFVKDLSEGSALEVLPRGDDGVWKVRLVIGTRQLEEILSEQRGTEALIEHVRTAASATLRLDKGGWRSGLSSGWRRLSKNM